MEIKAYLKYEEFKVSTIISEYNQSRISVPEFQRQYVWKPAKAVCLLDSLYRQYPVGSILLWKTKAAVETRARNKRSEAEAMWLIDGQQRTITLSRIYSGELEIWFNYKTCEFSKNTGKVRKSPDWYRVNDIWNDVEYSNLQQNFISLPDEQMLKYNQNMRNLRKVLDYLIPAVHMINHSHDDAVKAFERINTMGVRLSRADLESANIAARHTTFIKEKVQPFIDWVYEIGYHRLNVTHFFRVAGHIAHPNGRVKTPLHDLENHEVNSAWKKTETGFKKMTRLLKSELGLNNMNILSSGPILVPVMTLLANTDSQEIDNAELTGWLALASVFHRYGKSSGTRIQQDLKACRNADPVRALLKNLKDQAKSLDVRASAFNVHLYDKSILLSLYMLMRHNIKRTMGRISSDAEIHRHYIIPKTKFLPENRHNADTIANIYFTFNNVPESVTNHLKESDYKDLFIPENYEPLTEDNAELFWRKRRMLLAEAFNEMVGELLRNRRL